MEVARTPNYYQAYSSESSVRTSKGAPTSGLAREQLYAPPYKVTVSQDLLEGKLSIEEIDKLNDDRAKASGGYFRRMTLEETEERKRTYQLKMPEYDDEINSAFAHQGYYPKGTSIISYLYRTEADNVIDQGFAAMDGLNDKLVAMDSKLWKESELSANNLSKAAYSLIDSLEKSTGKYVVSQNQGIYDVKFGYAGEMCDIGINMLEFMANNRQHDDIWRNVVDGKYSSLGEIDTAIRSKGDTETADKLRDETLLTVTPCDERVRDMLNTPKLGQEYLWQRISSGTRVISDEEVQAYKESYIDKKDPYKREFTNGGYLWSAVAPRGTEKIVQQYNQYNRR